MYLNSPLSFLQHFYSGRKENVDKSSIVVFQKADRISPHCFIPKATDFKIKGKIKLWF